MIYTAIFLVALGLGAYLDHRYNISTITQTVEKEVIKRDVVTIVKEVVRPDGTKDTTTTTTDRSKENRTDSSTVVKAAPLYHISAIASIPLNASPTPIYGIQIERRFAGPFFLGVNAQTNLHIGLVVGMEF